MASNCFHQGMWLREAAIFPEDPDGESKGVPQANLSLFH